METDTKYYNLAGITIEVKSDLPILENTFDPKFKLFETKAPGNDTVSIHHHFESTYKMEPRLWERVYDTPPWKIYRTGHGWLYKRIHTFRDKSWHYCTAVFNNKHTHADIFHEPISKECYQKGLLDSLALFPTDEIFLTRILADRNSCFFHSNGVILKKKGLLFMGHSEAGKSTIARMLNSHGGKTLCDDRMIVRKTAQDIKMHGSWCHGKDEIFSSDTSSLDAIFFLTKHKTNKIILSENYQYNFHQLVSFIIKSWVTKKWWESNFNLIEFIIKRTPCYNLFFNKSGEIIDLIKRL